MKEQTFWYDYFKIFLDAWKLLCKIATPFLILIVLLHYSIFTILKTAQSCQPSFVRYKNRNKNIAIISLYCGGIRWTLRCVPPYTTQCRVGTVFSFVMWSWCYIIFWSKTIFFVFLLALPNNILKIYLWFYELLVFNWMNSHKKSLNLYKIILNAKLCKKTNNPQTLAILMLRKTFILIRSPFANRSNDTYTTHIVCKSMQKIPHYFSINQSYYGNNKKAKVAHLFHEGAALRKMSPHYNKACVFSTQLWFRSTLTNVLFYYYQFFFWSTRRPWLQFVSNASNWLFCCGFSAFSVYPLAALAIISHDFTKRINQNNLMVVVRSQHTMMLLWLFQYSQEMYNLLTHFSGRKNGEVDRSSLLQSSWTVYRVEAVTLICLLVEKKYFKFWFFSNCY